MTSPAAVLPLLADQLQPLLASRDALDVLADELEMAKRNLTPPDTSRHSRQIITAATVKLAIELILIRADALRSRPGGRTEAPASPSEDQP